MKTHYTIAITILSMLLLSSNSVAKKSSTDEYSGRHNEKNIKMAVTSKAFSWLSGSPADNEKLSIGKSAQFFGFVALRYQSDRVARRGTLGTAFHHLASEDQRRHVLDAAVKEAEFLSLWWDFRKDILTELENHLYTGTPIDHAKMEDLGKYFGLLNAYVGLLEASACSKVEASLSPKQSRTLIKWRKTPAKAEDKSFSRIDLAPEYSGDIASHYEDIFAKCFSYLTSTLKDREVMPLGQPAQFFGFVSIRHKSGRGAKRGQISQEFDSLLSGEQRRELATLAQNLEPKIKELKQERRDLLKSMDYLRVITKRVLVPEDYLSIAEKLGILEVKIAIAEAEAYAKVRQSMSDQQLAKMMDIRSDYVIDARHTNAVSGLERGEQLYKICSGCHQDNNAIAPNLSGIVGRNIGSQNFNYSSALATKNTDVWSVDLLDAFLAAPDKTLPGNKMGFAGLLNSEDRIALVEYLQTL